MKFILEEKKGFAAFFVTILVMTTMIGIAVSISLLTVSEYKILRGLNNSTQAYYAAESGIEDIVMRISRSKSWSPSYSFDCGASNVSVQVSDPVGGSRTITSQGDLSGASRRVRTVYAISTEEISFYYGAQVGDGGMLMANNARIRGNIYSNGSILPAKGGDKGIIDDTVIVANNGNRIEGLQVGQNAKAHTCKDSIITGSLTYVAGGSIENCVAGETIDSQPNEILPKDLPISQDQIDRWKQDAEEGGVIEGDYEIPIGVTVNLGLKKITGNFTINNNATLNMTGVVWVVGNLAVMNGSTIKLDHSSFGSLSGMIITDGKVEVRPGAVLQGSGEPESYLLLLSTNPEISDTTSPAIDVDNNADAAIFYASEGLIVMRNNIQAREVTGYKVYLDNNAEIIYESGLEEASFTSGPGGSWELANWREIE